mgnify:CR=1 FL=1
MHRNNKTLTWACACAKHVVNTMRHGKQRTLLGNTFFSSSSWQPHCWQTSLRNRRMSRFFSKERVETTVCLSRLNIVAGGESGQAGGRGHLLRGKNCQLQGHSGALQFYHNCKIPTRTLHPACTRLKNTGHRLGGVLEVDFRPELGNLAPNQGAGTTPAKQGGG